MPIDDEVPELPDEIMVWHHRPELWWLGSWATTRYPEEAVSYVPKADFERMKHAAELGLEVARANGLNITAETIREALNAAD
ncbi:hypothetical protein PVV74_17160 [Roseovarius sp. SK2]|uniref:hypothetical protein n=1 Tax=Roseovarius TaxID=74030 RepID=UPI00237A505A|nr:hypothetical protein [Roseovarius sp. SK2]MDD9727192.1 hypothetical protein [Roseovarius sp. SK2]